ncbi:hypothetical protein [Nocardiopsis synnemataformans]|uniref:hypothetical protein n=1 Tax=Nocardiopsis synnemataformans TaxID=61305 RepID=UPI003EBCB372
MSALRTLLHTTADSPLCRAYPDWWDSLLKWMKAEGLRPDDVVEITVTDNDGDLSAYVVELRRGPAGQVLGNRETGPVTATRTVQVDTTPPTIGGSL